jgi:transcriptional regulator with XRE-family HTH domain
MQKKKAKRTWRKAKGKTPELRAKRLERKITLSEMMKRTGLSQPTLWRIENGLSMRACNILLFLQALKY